MDTKPEMYDIVSPPKAKWSWTIDAWAVTFNVPTAPNIIHRAMQKIILGIQWRKIK